MCDLLVVTDESYGYSTQGIIIPMYKCKNKFLIQDVSLIGKCREVLLLNQRKYMKTPLGSVGHYL